MPSRAEDEALVRAFDQLIDSLLNALNGAGISNPPQSPAQAVTGALLGKILRLSDATGALAHRYHPNDTGPILRSILNLHVNLKFISTSESPDSAALRYMRYLRVARKSLRRHLLRPDVPAEGFPVMTKKAWDEDERQMNAEWKNLHAWATKNGVEEMEPLTTSPPWWRFWQKRRSDRTWTGLSDAALFARVGAEDAYRFYSFFSNEIHGNVAGIGDVITDVNAGRVEIQDDGPIAAPLTLAAKYAIRSIEQYRDLLGLAIEDATIQRIADEFSEALRRYPRN